MQPTYHFTDNKLVLVRDTHALGCLTIFINKLFLAPLSKTSKTPAHHSHLPGEGILHDPESWLCLYDAIKCLDIWTRCFGILLYFPPLWQECSKSQQWKKFNPKNKIRGRNKEAVKGREDGKYLSYTVWALIDLFTSLPPFDQQ